MAAFQERDEHPLHVEYWDFTQTTVKRAECVAPAELEVCLTEAVVAAKAELASEKEAWAALSKRAKDQRVAKGQLPRATAGRWLHMAGMNDAGSRMLAQHFHIQDDVLDSMKKSGSKPSVEWYRQPDSLLAFNYMYITGHYISVDGETQMQSNLPAVRVPCCQRTVSAQCVILSLPVAAAPRRWPHPFWTLHRIMMNLQISCDPPPRPRPAQALPMQRQAHEKS